MSVVVQGGGVTFGGVVALKNVSLDLARGQVLAVIGPNGSGKSTLFNLITGMVTASSGDVMIDGKSLARMAPHRRIALGIARTFQTPRFDPHVTVQDAVLCGFFPVARAGMVSSMLRLPASCKQERMFAERCDEILCDLHLERYRNVKVGELPMGQIRLVEVARAVANEPKYILLDEPAAGLARDEQAMLSREVRKLAARGIGVLLVEHNFNLIRDLADHVMVLNRGALLLSGNADEIARNKTFIDVYLGKTAQQDVRS